MRKRMTPRWWAVVAGVVLVFIVAAAIGSSAASTKTRTVTRTRVVYRTRTLSRIPVGCHHAISDARQFAGVIADFSSAASAFPTMVYQAAQAGQRQDAAAITAIANRMKRVNTRIGTDVALVRVLADEFNKAAATCK